jgi:hypothetical protein
MILAYNTTVTYLKSLSHTCIHTHTHTHMHVLLHLKRHSTEFEQIVFKFNIQREDISGNN